MELKDVQEQIIWKKYFFKIAGKMHEYKRVSLLYKKAIRQVAGSNNYIETIGRLENAFKKAKKALDEKKEQ